MAHRARSANLIGPANLAAVLGQAPTGTVLLDVRHTPPNAGDHADVQAYLDGHLPGAIFVDIDTDLAGVSTGTNGRRPLPAAQDFEKTVRRWGIDVTTPVVVYGAVRSPGPARAWWLLRWAGVQSVRLLDGGVAGWVAEGGELISGATEIEPSETHFAIQPGGLPVVELGDVPAFAAQGLLLDARPAAKFSHPSDAEAGHIPGARSAPVGEFFDAAGYLLPEAELRERLRSLGVRSGTEPAAYCGTGVAAALEVFVLAVLDIRARLYVGSASEWTADPSRLLAR
jgi:thiosulfate/3-mercaptopyruvate sulfurtransferase